MSESLSRVERLKDDILNGPIFKTLLMLGWPVVISNALQMLYNVVDTYWLGKIGKVAVSAPTVGFPVVFLLISIGFGFSIAGVSLVSQHTGAGSEGQADKAAGQVISFMLVSSILLGAVGYVISPKLLDVLMGVPKDVFPKALTYIRILFSGLPLMFLYFAFRSLIRGIGDMVTPMLVTGFSVVLNMALDPLLIFGLGGLPELGVAGAAVATVMSRGIASFVAIYLLFSGKLHINLRPKNLILKLRWVKQIVKIGIPSSIGQAGTAVGSVILMGLISRLGVVAVSAYGIGQRIIRLLNVAVWGLASPLTTMIGQNIGAKKEDRATVIAKKTFALSFGLLMLLGLTVFLLRRPLFHVFIDDQAVIDTGSRFLAIFIWSVPFFGIFTLTRSVFRGSGHTRPPMILSLIRLLLFRVGVSYVLAFGVLGINLGADGIWLGLFASNFLGGILAFGWFLLGTWKERTIEKTGKKDSAPEGVDSSAKSVGSGESSATK